MVGKHGWRIKGQMLRKLMIYPQKISYLSGPVHAIPKRINANISEVPHRKLLIFFQWLADIKYEWVWQELDMACVFAIKISIYIVCTTFSVVLLVSIHFGITKFDHSILKPELICCQIIFAIYDWSY